jgi:hypothetical protein
VSGKAEVLQGGRSERPYEDLDVAPLRPVSEILPLTRPDSMANEVKSFRLAFKVLAIRKRHPMHDWLFCDSKVVDDAKDVATLRKPGSDFDGAVRIAEVGNHELTQEMRRRGVRPKGSWNSLPGAAFQSRLPDYLRAQGNHQRTVSALPSDSDVSEFLGYRSLCLLGVRAGRQDRPVSPVDRAAAPCALSVSQFGNQADDYFRGPTGADDTGASPWRTPSAQNDVTTAQDRPPARWQCNIALPLA